MYILKPETFHTNNMLHLAFELNLKELVFLKTKLALKYDFLLRKAKKLEFIRAKSSRDTLNTSKNPQPLAPE